MAKSRDHRGRRDPGFILSIWIDLDRFGSMGVQFTARTMTQRERERESEKGGGRFPKKRKRKIKNPPFFAYNQESFG